METIENENEEVVGPYGRMHDRDLHARWIDALRTGEKYRQGYNALCVLTTGEDGDDVFSHCCLGVLSELAGATRSNYPDGFGEYHYTYPGTEGSPSENVEYKTFPPSKWLISLGIPEHTSERLAAMNDGSDSFDYARHTFPQIADWIAENL